MASIVLSMRGSLGSLAKSMAGPIAAFGSLAGAVGLLRSSVKDVDTLAIYDGFTHLPISWVEALGFCGKGEFAGWAKGGTADRIARTELILSREEEVEQWSNAVSN